MNPSLIFLSFPLSRKTPAYGNGNRIEIRAVNSINKGDSCNTSEWILPNHLGTHIDAPNHFDRTGLTIDQFSADYWICQSIGIVDIPSVQPAELISSNRMEMRYIPQDIEILLIKTDFIQYRYEDIYWQMNPGLKPNLANDLRAKYPMLKLIGLDAISVSSYANRELGRAAHRAFLSGDKPLLIIEDMDLSKLNQHTKIKKIIIAPLIVEGADGAPCTVIAEVL